MYKTPRDIRPEMCLGRNLYTQGKVANLNDKGILDDSYPTTSLGILKDLPTHRLYYMDIMYKPACKLSDVACLLISLSRPRQTTSHIRTSHLWVPADATEIRYILGFKKSPNSTPSVFPRRYEMFVAMNSTRWRFTFDLRRIEELECRSTAFLQTYVAAWDLVLATTKVVKAQAAEAQMFYHHLDHVIRMYKIVKLTIWHTNEAAMELWLTPSALVRTWRQRQTIWVSRKGAELIISRTLIQDSRMSRASDEKVDRVAVWLNRAELATITIARTIYLGMSMGLALRRILHGIRLCRYQLDFRGDAFRRALQLAGKKSS
ncbi:hypothetical protein FPOAC1_003477 [Fusarium poae]|uniref:hypothetical protein n=1 Tax=Fusarium poae TaxID=36050 RepID=UPI001CEAA424|nr:hypothetical protein FPOAC1_003477 [Fusarium poae]KAG8677459.1 hypothetical protein FPOAC1_003477 [Fusarium poae]